MTPVNFKRKIEGRGDLRVVRRVRAPAPRGSGPKVTRGGRAAGLGAAGAGGAGRRAPAAGESSGRRPRERGIVGAGPEPAPARGGDAARHIPVRSGRRRGSVRGRSGAGRGCRPPG